MHITTKRRFIIDKPKAKTPEGFYFEVEFMFGDADGEAFETAGPFHESDFGLANDFIDFLDAVIKGRWPDRPSSHDYESHRREYTGHYPPRWGRFVEDCWPEDEDHPCSDCETYKCDGCDKKPLQIHWPNDPQSDYQYAGCMRRYRMYYIDDYGNEFSVIIEDLYK